MKRLISFLVLCMMLVAGSAFGITYNIGPGQTYETFTALEAAVVLAGDDIVDGGGNTFMETWIPATSGTSGHPIILQNAVIDANGGNYCIDITQEYITCNNLTFTGSVSAAVYGRGASDTIIFNDCNISVSAGRGFYGGNCSFDSGSWSVTGADGVQVTTGSKNFSLQNATLTFSITDYGFYFRNDGTNTITGNTIILSGTPNSLAVTTNSTACVLIFSSNTITPTVATGTYFFDFRSAVVDLTFNSNTITPHSSQTSYILVVANQDSPTISGNTINTTGMGTTQCWPIYIYSTGTSLGTVTLTNNIILTSALDGYGMRIGAESTDAGNNFIDGAVITGNKICGPYIAELTLGSVGIHGLFYGFNVDGIIERNYVEGCRYGIVAKGGGDAFAYTSGGINWNYIKNCPYGILVKGCKDVPVTNNKIDVSNAMTVATVPHFLAGDGVTSKGALLRNNIITGPAILIQTDTTSDTDFVSDYNCLYRIGGGNVAKIDSTEYTFADWQTATYDANSVNGLPTSANLKDLGTAVAGINDRDITDYYGKLPYGPVDIGEKQTFGISFGRSINLMGPCTGPQIN